MVVVFSLLAVVLSLVLVVGLHEAGHAWAAHLFKVKIKTISIGFGRALLSWRVKNGCQWVWAMWPVGGYVQLLNSRVEPVDPSAYRFSFDKKPVWVRCVILLAGAFVNVITAWLALVLLFILGYQQTSPIIAETAMPSLAATAGLARQDQIISIAGQKVSSWRDVGMQLIITLGQKHVDVVVENGRGVRRQVQLDLTQWHNSNESASLLTAIGIKPDLSDKNISHVVGLPLLQACHQAFLQLIGLCVFFLSILKQLIMGAIPFSVLLGPLGVFAVMVDSFFQGVAVFLYFIASLSLSVAIINLLPIPGLDGGSIVYALVEKIRGKPVSVRGEILLHRLVFIAFCLLLVQLLLNDMQRYLH